MRVDALAANIRHHKIDGRGSDKLRRNRGGVPPREGAHADRSRCSRSGGQSASCVCASVAVRDRPPAPHPPEPAHLAYGIPCADFASDLRFN